MKYPVVTVTRTIVGLFVLVSGLNAFVPLTPMPVLENPTGKLVMLAFTQSGMMEFAKVVEIICGLALVMNLYVPLTLVVFYPITCIIAFLDLLILGKEANALYFGGALFVWHTITLFFYLPYYRSMFVRRAQPDTALSVLKANSSAL